MIEPLNSSVSELKDKIEKEEIFNFESTTPLEEPEHFSNKNMETGLDDLVNDHLVDFSPALPPTLPQLPIGTVDLTQPREELSDNEMGKLPFGEEVEEPTMVESETDLETEFDTEIDSVVSLYHQVEKQYPHDIDKQYFHFFKFFWKIFVCKIYIN